MRPVSFSAFHLESLQQDYGGYGDWKEDKAKKKESDSLTSENSWMWIPQINGSIYIQMYIQTPKIIRFQFHNMLKPEISNLLISHGCEGPLKL